MKNNEYNIDNTLLEDAFSKYQKVPSYPIKLDWKSKPGEFQNKKSNWK